jgi:hypothetical protein
MAVFFLASRLAYAADPPRKDNEINSGWRTVQASDTNAFAGFEQPGFDDRQWKLVDVPHNWDDYFGFHQVKHGNLHGSAWYRRQFTADPADRGRCTFLMFEGVGSYATVWVNGRLVGRHAGGRTTFTLDVTRALVYGSPNVIAVRADHPAGIQDLPWVCGGCDPRTGFSEGSQPLGIFRPVRVIVTAPVRIEPFGVHVWNAAGTSAESAVVHVNTEAKNYGQATRRFTVVNRLLDREGNAVAVLRDQCTLAPGRTQTIRQTTPALASPHLWSPDDPYLYDLRTELVEDGTVLDETVTAHGICWLEWPEVGLTNCPFLFNGKPVFLNGTCEYEHLLGNSHAFSDEQIRARVMQFRAAGFNAFRDAHQPHNLRYQDYWERLGVLWWPQFSAQIWFDTPAFRENFKNLTRDWVKERRNNPAIILWGLQNESKLPEDFAKECCDLIRELDPTASAQRKIVACNGGVGTDWNVPQNWTGTYGGDPEQYANDARRQQLIGEYGGFRSIDYHEEGPFDLAAHQPKIATEDRFTALMETKVRLAESVRSEFCGHFQWLLATHDNPGRSVEGCWDGWRELDQIGVVNNKGLFTSWGEPLDAFYMFRANYASPHTEPMVYIVSHTWPDRWTTPGKKRGIVVYSNCDEVELFNDFQQLSLGRRTRGGKGTHFQWDDVDIQYNLLYAEGSVDGKVAATDIIQLHHLPPAPGFERSAAVSAAARDREEGLTNSPAKVRGQSAAGGTPALRLMENETSITAPEPGQNYLYRVNCGGPEYRDVQGNTWQADRHWKRGDSWGSTSWADAFADVPPEFASQRTVCGPIAGTRDDKELFTTFRYGRDQLKYRFHVPNGDYRIELYFIEPWYGVGGGMDCTGWRLFDVAVNGNVVLTNLDLWRETGCRRAIKKVGPGRADKGRLEIGFPRVASYQAVISAIAISSSNPKLKPPRLPPVVERRPFTPPPRLISDFSVKGASNPKDWAAIGKLRTGNLQYSDAGLIVTNLASGLYGSDWVRTPLHAKGRETIRFVAKEDVDVYVALNNRIERRLTNNDPAGGQFTLYRKRFAAGATVNLGGLGAATTTNDAPMFTVLINDARPMVSYPAASARRGPAGPSIEWTVKVGVADTYGLRFRFTSSAATAIPMRLEVIASDGRVLSTRQLEFPLTERGKTGIVPASTGVIINAGTYTIRLTAIGAGVPDFETLEVE